MHSMVNSTSPTGRPLSSPHLLPAAISAAILAFSGRCCPAAVDEFIYDQKLVKALAEVQEPKMKDFARVQVDFMLERYKVTEQRELITLEQSRLYFMTGSKEGAQQAEQILAKIPASSPNIAAVYLLKGDMYYLSPFNR